MIMINLNNQKEKIIKVLFIFNIASMLLAFFYSSKSIIIGILGLNIILLGTYFILKNNEGLFYSILDKNSLTKQLKNTLENTE